MENLNKKISTTLKSLRKTKGWSLDVASKNTNVSKAMLGQIERGESSPTISILWKIASGFDVPFSSFVDDVNLKQPEVLLRSVELKQLHQKDDKINVMTVFPYDKTLGFEMFIIELLPGCIHISPPHQKGVIEHIVPIKGKIEVMVDNKWYTVKKHDGFRFSAEFKHGYRNNTKLPVLFHDIIHYKKTKT